MKNRVVAGMLSLIMVCQAMNASVVMVGAAETSEIEVISVGADISDQGIKITKQPEDVSADVGETVNFSVTAEGVGLKYQWEYSRDNGATWVKSANTKATCAVAVTDNKNGWIYRSILTDKDGNAETTSGAKLTINVQGIKITKQPNGWSGSVGGMAYFNIEAEGEELKYQWQISGNNGKTWSLSSIISTEYSTAITQEKNGWLYRCAVTNKEEGTVYSQTVKLIVSEEFLILQQPQDSKGNMGDIVSFLIQVGGTNITYQWQESVDGLVWKDIISTSTAKLARMRQSRTPSTIGHYYKCVVKNDDGKTLVSDAVRIFFDGEGFVTYGGKTYYILENGLAAEGWQTINGKNYYFSNSGVMQVGFQIINDDRYYFDLETGEAVTGFVTLESNGRTYYFDGINGTLKGLQEINGRIYYFSSVGIVQYGLVTIAGKRYYFAEDGVAIIGWFYVKENHNTYYFAENGAATTGWFIKDENTYYFYANGVMARGITVVEGKHVYFDVETGIQRKEMVQVGIDNYMSFSEESGEVQTGLKEIDGKLYYFSEEKNKHGVAMSGLQTIDGVTYYFDSKTKQAVKGFVKDDSGNTYYMGEDFTMKVGLQNIEGATYYFNNAGILTKGMKFLSSGVYYFSEESGKATSGWYTSDNEGTFYFDSETFAAVSGIQQIDGDTYYFTATGRLMAGFITAEGCKYYFAENGKKQEGFLTVGGKVYYIAEHNMLLTGMQIIDGKMYYFNDNGVMQTGYQILSEKRYYFNQSTGEAVTGFVTQTNGNIYYFDGAQGGLTGLQTIEGKLYYLSESSVVQKGRYSIGGNYYVFNSHTGAAEEGWVECTISNGDIYKAYIDEETHQALIGLHTIDGELYYFSSSGWMQTGRCVVDGTNYYFNETSGKAYTGWYENNGYTYYYNGGEGRVNGPTIYEVEGKTYYFNENNVLSTGMKNIDGKNVYFDPNTAELTVGFKKVNETVYYFDGMNGALAGEQEIDGNRYFFSAGGSMRYGYQNIDGKRYYFDEVTGIRVGGMQFYEGNERYYLFDTGAETGVNSGAATYGDVLYVLSDSGIPGTGFYSATSNPLGFRAYFDEETGEQQLGLITYTNSSGSEYTYYFQPNDCIYNINAVSNALAVAKQTNGWAEVEGLTYYVENGQFLVGLQTLSGKGYYFSLKSGAMLTGLRRIGSDYYYFNQATGEMQTGWCDLEGRKFYFDTNSGKMLIGLVSIDEETYYLLQGGGFAVGEVIAGNTIYTFSSEGVGREEPEAGGKPEQSSDANQWKVVEDKKYYYNESGQFVTGMQIIAQKLFYFDEGGALVIGKVEKNGKTYYFTEEGAITGLFDIEGDRYYFSPIDYSMRVGLCNVDGKKYFFDEDGKLRTGWIELSVGNKSYFSSDEGIWLGLQIIDGKTYWFGTDGIMATGVKTVEDGLGTQFISYFDDNGIMQKGLVKTESGVYYYDEGTGARRTGWVTLAGENFYFNETTGAAVTGLKNIEDYYYYFDSETGKRKLGLQKQNGKIYCLNDSGETDGLSRGFMDLDGQTYYFNEDGIALIGAQYIDGIRYYFDLETGASIGGIHWIGQNSAYAFKAGGGCETGLLEFNERKYYFYSNNSKMAVGLVSIGNVLYYFDAQEGMLKNTAVEVGGIIYELDANGAARAQGESNIARLINSGIEKLGSPYGSESSADANDLEGSYSCSNFVSTVLGDIGVDVTETAYLQNHSLLYDGYEVEFVSNIEEAKPGDLIYLSTMECKFGEECTFWNEIHHVMIYLGDGKVMESTSGVSDDRRGVMIQDWSENPSGFVYNIIRINEVNN